MKQKLNHWIGLSVLLLTMSFFFYRSIISDPPFKETLAAIEAADEILIVTNPEISAVTDALKASKIAEQLGTKVSGLILNRVTGRSHEMTRRDVLGMLDNVNLIGEVPEDVAVQKAVAMRNPVVRVALEGVGTHEGDLAGELVHLRRRRQALVGLGGPEVVDAHIEGRLPGTGVNDQGYMPVLTLLGPTHGCETIQFFL